MAEFLVALGESIPPKLPAAGSWLLIAVLGWAPPYAFSGQYKGLTRYVGSAAFYRLAGRNGLQFCC